MFSRWIKRTFGETGRGNGGEVAPPPPARGGGVAR